jgi:hypothetical protein
MNIEDAQLGMAVKIRDNLSKTKALFKLDGNGEMLAMVGKIYKIEDIDRSNRGGSITIQGWFFSPKDLELFEETESEQNKLISRTFVFDPTNLFTGKAKCRKKKKL